MADYVSRSKVEFELCVGNLSEKYKAFVRRVLNDKNLVPAVDVAPVVHGRWVYVGENSTGKIFTCSDCKFPHNPNKKRRWSGESRRKSKLLPQLWCQDGRR